MLRKEFVLIGSLVLLRVVGLGFCQLPPDPGPIPPDDAEQDLTIEQKYEQLGGATGFLGQPVGAEKPAANGGKYREYKGGSIYWHPSTGAHELHGDILKKYKLLGADKCFLGYPTTDVLPGTDGGHYSMFQGGVILWKTQKMSIGGDPKKMIWAFEVHGQILAKYKELKAYAGLLGYPRTDELKTFDGKGRYSEFEGGIIYWSPQTGAHEVHGTIGEKYSMLGSCDSLLGYPITDERKTPDGVGRFNHFQNGSIYWTPTTGAREVHGKIRDKWKEMGWEKSWLGYPTSDEFSIPGTDGRRSIFVNGAIDWYPGTGAKAVKHFYDLKALDWCYKLNPQKTLITFRAVVANIGTQTVHGPGEVALGVTVGHIVVGTPAWNNQKIAPDFKLAPGQTCALTPGLTVSFKSNIPYECLEYRFNIAGEPPRNWCDPGFLNDLKSGKNNNGRTFFSKKSGADVGLPKEPRHGSWIEVVTSKWCY